MYMSIVTDISDLIYTKCCFYFDNFFLVNIFRHINLHQCVVQIRLCMCMGEDNIRIIYISGDINRPFLVPLLASAVFIWRMISIKHYAYRIISNVYFDRQVQFKKCCACITRHGIFTMIKALWSPEKGSKSIQHKLSAAIEQKPSWTIPHRHNEAKTNRCPCRKRYPDIFLVFAR